MENRGSDNNNDDTDNESVIVAGHRLEHDPIWRNHNDLKMGMADMANLTTFSLIFPI